MQVTQYYWLGEMWNGPGMWLDWSNETYLLNLYGKAIGKIPDEWLEMRLKDNIKMYLREIGCEFGC
jgi:hypothetical protein